MEIEKLFDYVGKKEKHQFVLNQFYEQSTKLRIPNDLNEMVNVTAMIIKNDKMMDISFDGDIKLQVGEKHRIINSDSEEIYACELNPGDYLWNLNGKKKVKDVSIGNEEIVYDLSIDTDSHLYYDSFGFLHHNTFTVTERLEKSLGSKGQDWIIVKGKSSPMGLYMSLFLNREKLIVFDDMDSVFANKDTVNIIKAAVDSYDEREISWISPTTQTLSGLDDLALKMKFAEIEDAFTTGNPDAGKGELKLPSQFVFTGRVIFISNIHESKMDKAIKSRSFVIDITLRAEDVIRRMESILEKISPNVDIGTKKEVLNYLKEEASKMKDGVNLRTLINGIKCKLSGSPRWKHLMVSYG